MSTPAPTPGLSALFTPAINAPSGRTAAAVAASIGMDSASSPFAALLSSSLAAPVTLATPLPLAPPAAVIAPSINASEAVVDPGLASLLPTLVPATGQRTKAAPPDSEAPAREREPLEAASPEADAGLPLLTLAVAPPPASAPASVPSSPLTHALAATDPAVDQHATLSADARPSGSPLPATDSARARALQAAANAANAQATPASGKAPGPDHHAFEALLKHAEPGPEPAATMASGLASAAAEILQRGVRRSPGMPALTELSAPTPSATATPAPLSGAAPASPLASLEGTLAPPPDTDLLLAEPNQPADTQSPDFPDELGTRLTWLAERRIGHAQIRVAPPELGAVDVRLQLDGDRVRVDFSSPHAEVRAALEASLPRLRDMLQAQGMTLVDSQIGQHSGGRAQDGGTQQESLRLADAELVEDESHPGTSLRAQRGLLDEYA